jgi:hypothetical protein
MVSKLSQVAKWYYLSHIQMRRKNRYLVRFKRKAKLILGHLYESGKYSGLTDNDYKLDLSERGVLNSQPSKE